MIPRKPEKTSTSFICLLAALLGLFATGAAASSELNERGISGRYTCDGVFHGSLAPAPDRDMIRPPIIPWPIPPK